MTNFFRLVFVHIAEAVPVLDIVKFLTIGTPGWVLVC